MQNPAPRETILSLFSQTPDGFVSGERISAVTHERSFHVRVEHFVDFVSGEEIVVFCITIVYDPLTQSIVHVEETLDLCLETLPQVLL